ncbi:MAG TPA: hypothetical protein VGN95_16880 [Pyrinomonadaceae bacterium]|nr:hypothetical protein [Pyrinomonadaceae bacterium]
MEEIIRDEKQKWRRVDAGASGRVDAETWGRGEEEHGEEELEIPGRYCVPRRVSCFVARGY